MSLRLRVCAAMAAAALLPLAAVGALGGGLWSLRAVGVAAAAVLIVAVWSWVRPGWLIEPARVALRVRRRASGRETLAVVGKLGAGLAHELNNPLMGITGLVSCVKDALPADDQKRKLLEDAEGELKRCCKLVTDLLVCAWPNAEQGAAPSFQVDCRDVIRRALTVLDAALRKANVTVTLRLQPELPRVWGDTGQLEQVVLNLVTNAVDAMASSPTKQLMLSVQSTLRGVDLVVTDTGCGIPPELLSKVCTPFFTTKPPGEGTGLGLSVSRSVVDAHRGQLFIESQLDRGTTVTVRLPLERRSEDRRGRRT